MKRRISSKTANRIFLVVLIVLVLFSISAEVAEARAIDTVKNFWNHSRRYVKSPAYWVNALILFSVLFLFQALVLKDKIGSDTAQKTMIYIILGMLALVIATKIVATNGVPQYIWKVGSFAKFTRFLLGAGPDGTYTKTVAGNTVTKQGILRAGPNGAGLPALIIAFILLYLLFNAYKSELGLDSGGGKWIQLSLSLVLAALIANEGTTKNTLIIIGGWISVILLGGRLGRAFSGDADPKGAKKGFGFGLAFAFIQLIANILGTSLFGGEYNAADITAWLIIRNVFIGLLIGFIYSSMSGEGIFGRWRKNVRNDDKETIEQMKKEGSYIKAGLRFVFPLLSRLPKIREWLKPHGLIEQAVKKDEKIAKELERLYMLYNNEIKKQPPSPVRLSRINNMIIALEEKLTEELTAKELEEISEDTGIPVSPSADQKTGEEDAPPAPAV